MRSEIMPISIDFGLYTFYIVVPDEPFRVPKDPNKHDKAF